MNRPAVSPHGSVPGAEKPFVVQRQGEGFTIYAPDNPSDCYEVAGTSQHPKCTCAEYVHYASDHPEMSWHRPNPDYRCPHINFVFGAVETVDEDGLVTPLRKPQSAFTTNCDPDYPAEDEPLALVLKRSVSPDGRINSLSIELTCPLGDNDFDDVRPKVEGYLSLQADVADLFREQYARSGASGQAAPAGQPPAQPQSDPGNGSVPVQLLSFGGMRTRYGWRTFLTVQSNGQTLKLFGTKQELGEWIAKAGYPQLSQNLSNGTQLNVPCRAVLKATPDGKYVNVEQLLPSNGGTQPAGRRW